MILIGEMLRESVRNFNAAKGRIVGQKTSVKLNKTFQESELSLKKFLTEALDHQGHTFLRYSAPTKLSCE